MAKILIFDSRIFNVINFRFDMIKFLQSHGHEVIVAAPLDDLSVFNNFELANVKLFNLPISGASLNPFKDFSTVRSIKKCLIQSNPDIILSFTMKCVLYVSKQAKKCGFENINSFMTGLGSLFTSNALKIKILRFLLLNILLKKALLCNKKIFFHNNFDIQFLLSRGLLNCSQAVLINGSGVNLEKFKSGVLPEKPSFLMAARLIKEKGVFEYIEAASIVRSKYPDVKFYLAGTLDANPSSLTQKQLDMLVKTGDIIYLGFQKDMKEVIEKSSVCVLPSYREGRSKFLLEAMAMGRAIITTNAPGCAEAIKPNINGFLVPVGDADSLAQACINLIENEELIKSMGEESLFLAQDWYDVNKINQKILAEIQC